MKATAIGPDGRLIWTEAEDPVAGDGDVLLKVAAAGLNRADLMQRAGKYPPPPGWPDRFGLEAAGEIVAVGKDVKNWKVGDRVCALLGSGGYAEYVAVPQELLMSVPEGLSMVEAAALPEAFGASYLFLFWEGKLQPGETVLVTAGASGLSSVLIPMAKAHGARVITTVRKDAQVDAIAHLKPDLIVNTSRQSLAEVMKAELEAGRGVDVCVDCVGGDQVGQCLPYMNFDGRWIMIAALAGEPSTVNLRGMYSRRVRLIGTNLRSRSNGQKQQLLGEVAQRRWPKVASGEVKPTIFRVYPACQAEEAQALMASGGSVGKIILTME